MFRRVAFLALLIAWLFANGAIWNTVQVVAWARMFRDYATAMPAATALRLTFEGGACELCRAVQSAQDTAREQLPADAALGGTDRLVLATVTPTRFVVAAPAPHWPAPTDRQGPARPHEVAVPPPRA